MAHYVRQHFIPQFILRNYGVDTDKDNNDQIYVYSNYEFKIDRKIVADSYMVENLYDSNQFDDIKKLEKDLGEYLEKIIAPVFKKLSNSNNEFVINRDELKLIKKYLLIQLYRTEVNMTYYLNQNVKSVELSSSSIKQGESKLDFWKREMFTILHTKWDDLLKSDFPLHGVRHFAMEIQQGHLCFVQTKDEFIMNDLGKVSELIPVVIPEDKVDGYRKAAEFLSQVDLPQAKEIFEYELKNKTSKLETFSFYPVSPIIAVILARKHNIGPSHINFYENSLAFSIDKFGPPFNRYRNNEVYEVNRQILELQKSSNTSEAFKKANELYVKRESLFDVDDEYVYSIRTLSKDETIRINVMILNETRKYVTFKTPNKVVESIKSYNYLYNTNFGNIKNNFNGMLGLLKSLENNDEEEDKIE
jgi:hypothetical protein